MTNKNEFDISIYVYDTELTLCESDSHLAAFTSIMVTS